MKLNGTFKILADKPVLFEDGLYKCGIAASIDGGTTGVQSAIDDGVSVYVYIRAYNAETQDVDIKRFRLMAVSKAGTGRKKYNQFELQPEINDGYAIYNGELDEDTLNGIVTTLSSDRGFAYIPTARAGLDTDFREDLRNVDLAYYEAKRTKEIDDIVQDLKENYAKAETITEIHESVERFDDSISGILERLGATETQVTDIRNSLLARLDELEIKVQSHSETIEALTSQVETNTGNINELRADHNSLKEQYIEHVAQTNKNVEQWNANFEAHKQAIQALDDRDQLIVTKVNSHSEVIDELLSKVQVADKGYEDMSSEFVAVKDKVQELETDNEALRASVSDSLQRIKLGVDENKANIANLQRDSSKLAHDFSDMSNNYTQAMESINSFTNDIENINNKNQEIDNHLNTIDTSFENINNDIDSLKAKDIDHDSKFTKLDGTITDLNAKDVSHDNEIENLKIRIQTLSEAFDLNNQQILDLIDETESKLKNDISETQELLSSEVGDLQDKDSTHDQQIAQIVFKNTNQDNDIGSLKTKVSGLEIKVQSHSESNEVIIKDLKDLKGSVRDNAGSIRGIEANLEGVSSTIVDHQEAIDNLNNSTKTLTNDLNSHKTDFNEHKEYVIQELTSLKGRVKANEDKIKELDNSITSVQEHIQGELGSFQERVDFEIQDLKDLTGSHSTDISQIKQDIENISINISDLEGCTKAVQINSEDQIDSLNPYTFGLVTEDVDLGDDMDYSQILVDITTLKTQNSELLSRVKTLESENQNLKLKLGD